MDTPDRITHAIARDTRPGSARLRSWKEGRVTSVIETRMDWEHGVFRVSDRSSVIHPGHRGHADAVLAKVGAMTGLGLAGGLAGDVAAHGSCRVVADGGIVVWAVRARDCVVGHARELTVRGPVVETEAPFGKQRDDDGATWMTVGLGISSPFPRRGAIKAMYDAVEQVAGVEMRPMGWNGMGGILNDGRIYTLWRKRLALRGIDVDDGLTAEVIARTRQALPQGERDALDRWVEGAIARFDAEGAAPAPR